MRRYSDGRMEVGTNSVMGHNFKDYDGYINRNIRLSLGIIEASKPYIQVVSVTEDKKSGKIQIEWQVNGCYSINEAMSHVNSTNTIHIKKGDAVGACNYYLVT